MLPAQIRIVRQSFARVAGCRQRVAALFYQNLFDVDPTFRLLLPGDLRGRGATLIDALAMMVENLHRPHVFIPALEMLAVRHVGYGLERSHYAVVREALLRTVTQALGADLTAEIEAAWGAAYDFIVEEMIANAWEDVRLAA